MFGKLFLKFDNSRPIGQCKEEDYIHIGRIEGEMSMLADGL